MAVNIINVPVKIPTENQQPSDIEISLKSKQLYNRIKQALIDGADDSSDIDFSLNFNIIDNENIIYEDVFARKEFFSLLMKQTELIFVFLRDRCVFKTDETLNGIVFDFNNVDGSVTILARSERLFGTNYEKLEQLAGIIYNQKIIADYNYNLWETNTAGVTVEHNIPFYN